MFAPDTAAMTPQWMPLFGAFALSLLLTAKYSLQLLVGKRNHVGWLEGVCGWTAASVACLLARDAITLRYSLLGVGDTLFSVWDLLPIGLAIGVSRLHFLFANLTLTADELRRSPLVWTVMLCSVGTTVWSGSRYQHETAELSVAWTGGEFEGHWQPVADLVATTDDGRELPLEVWQADLAAKESKVVTTELQPIARYLDRIVRQSPQTPETNCHGWVFTNGRYKLSGHFVDRVLDDNRYEVVAEPREGDLIIYRGPQREVLHSGIVREVRHNGLVIESKWGVQGGRFLHAPEVQPYSETFAYYRSPRSGHAVTIRPVTAAVQVGNSRDSSKASQLHQQ